MAAKRPLALVTGASAGIGSVFAEKLAARGYDLVLVARREDRLEELAARLAGQHGAHSRVLAADLTHDDGLQAVEQAIDGSADLALLVNNAGFGTRGLFYEADAALQRRMYGLHVVATMRLAQAALPGMVKRARGAVINVASVAGFMQTPGNVSYCSTKAWIISFTEGLAMELRMMGSPVQAQALCPGFTVTEFHEVMGVDRSQAPESWWMSAGDVVEDSLRALEQDKWLVVPGARYKLIVRLMGLLPRRLKWWISLRRGREIYLRRGGHV